MSADLRAAPTTPAPHTRVLDHGYAIVPPLPLTHAQLAELTAEADRLLVGARAGARNALNNSAAIGAFAASPAARDLIEPVLGPHAFVARSIVFDKSPQANWDVAWHQDPTIAVVTQIDTPGFGPWSVKSGVPHVQPPADVLRSMLTLRLHLDDCTRDNGALWVVPGSHESLIPAAAIDGPAYDERAVVCECPRAGAVLMRPLLLHASRKSTNPSRRRVIHLEFAAEPLPGALEWARL